MNKDLLEINQLTISPKNNPQLHLVDDISFQLKKGKTTCIVGESGSGKSLTALSIIKLLSNHESLVHKLDMFPIECVVRNRATGSLCKRLGIEDGLILDPPLFEFFLKDDDLGDPLINDHHIESFGWATQEVVDAMRDLTLKINDILVEFFMEANLILVDYKLEFGKFNDKMLLADEFTPDGCRLWDKDTLTKMDKDRFRQDLGNVIETYGEVGERLGMKIKLD